MTQRLVDDAGPNPLWTISRRAQSGSAPLVPGVGELVCAPPPPARRTVRLTPPLTANGWRWSLPGPSGQVGR